MKKNHMIAALATAGLVTVGLVAYKMQSGGSFGLPASIVALMPWGDKPAPLKRDFPSHANDAEVIPDAGAMPTDGEVPGAESAAVDGDLPVEAGTAGTAQLAPGGAAVVPGDDVDSRIARSQALSKMLMNETPASATAATATTMTKAGATGTAAFAGEWTGEFFGPDAGTVAVTISPDGTARGRGLSTMTSLSFDLVGKVASNGKVELTKSAAGVTSTGAVFTGSILPSGAGKGTWTVPDYNISGTWQMNAQPVQ